MSDAAPQLAAADLERLLVHADWLRALARRLVGGAAADDVVQDTLIAAMQSPPDAERPPRPWLGRVLRNVARMRYRSESRRAHREDVAALAPPTSSSPSDAVERLQTHRALCDVVLALEEPYRHTLVMHYYDGRALADIARTDGVPEATVRWRHRHALDLIRARLDERAGGDRRTWLAALAPLAAPEPTALLTKGLLVKKTVAAVVAIVVALLVTWRLASRGSTPEDAPPPAVEAPAPSARLDFGRGAPRVDGTAAAGRIRGRVHGPAGPVRATLLEMSSDATRVTEAGVDGERAFDFAAVPPGTYCLVAVAAQSGLGASACDVVVRAGETVERDLELVLRTGRVTGVISDADGGAIPAPLVVAQRLPGLGATTSATRGDANGRYDLALAPGWYRIVASADGYTSARHHLEVRADETLDLRLNAGATIAGRVLDPDRRPAPGATVWVDTRSVVAGPDGRFSVDGLRPDRFDVIASLGELVAPPREVVVAFGGTADVELVLGESRAAIAGRVVDGDGRPVANARVDATGPLDRHATTGADGAFRITGLVAGTYDVVGVAANFVRAQTTAIVGPDGESVADIKLARGVTVRGVVRTARGEAVAGATVATSASNLRDPRLDVTTDASGAFRVGPLPIGQVRLSAYHREHGVSEIVQLDTSAAASPDAELVFRAAAAIAGRVRYDDGTPAAGAQVTITPADAPARWSLSADRDGRFALDSLPAGTYSIDARPPVVAALQAVASGKMSATVKLAPGAPHQVELEVPGGREHLRGRVVDGSGAPVAGAAVWAERIWEGIISPVSLDEVRTYSWNDGAFDVAELPRGTYNVYAQHSDGRRGIATKISSGTSNLELVVKDGARITGRVVGRDGRPVRAFLVEWRWLSRQSSMAMARSRGFRAVHHPDGEFALDNLDPSSEYTVSVKTPDGSTGASESFELAAGEVHSGVRIEVVGMGTIRGRVVRKDTGAPLLGHVIFFPGHAPTDGDGRFEAKAPAGTYEHINLQNEAQGYPDIEVKFTVEPGKTADLGEIRVAPR